MGKSLLIVGALIFGLGLLTLGLDRLGIHLGRLPGDIRVEGQKGGFHFPVVTCLVVSVIASVLWNLFGGRR